MAFNKRTEELISKASLADQILREDPSVSEKMLTVGYNEERINEGLAALDELRDSYKELKSKGDDILAKSQELMDILPGIRTKYTQLLKVLRAAYFLNKEKYKELRLQGERPYLILLMAIHADQRKEKILDDPGAMEVLARNGLTQEKVEEIFENIQLAASKKRYVISLRADSQGLTARMTEAQRGVEQYRRELKAAAEMAMETNIQEIEKLGFPSKNVRKKPVKKPAINDGSTTDTTDTGDNTGDNNDNGNTGGNNDDNGGSTNTGDDS